MVIVRRRVIIVYISYIYIYINNKKIYNKGEIIARTIPTLAIKAKFSILYILIKILNKFL
jgi:hypothetical protein